MYKYIHCLTASVVDILMCPWGKQRQYILCLCSCWLSHSEAETITFKVETIILVPINHGVDEPEVSCDSDVKHDRGLKETFAGRGRCLLQMEDWESAGVFTSDGNVSVRSVSSHQANVSASLRLSITAGRILLFWCSRSDDRWGVLLRDDHGRMDSSPLEKWGVRDD